MRSNRKRHRPEEVVAKLRQADEALAKGPPIAEVARSLGVSEVTLHRWRAEYGDGGDARYGGRGANPGGDGGPGDLGSEGAKGGGDGSAQQSHGKEVAVRKAPRGSSRNALLECRPRRARINSQWHD